jgi:two-component system phosphate regulon sensor histidine kinase PhoR
MTEVGPDEQALLGALPDGVMLVTDGRVAYANPAASRLLGMLIPELLTRLSPSALVDLVTSSADEPSEEVFQRGSPPRWIEASARPLTDGGDGVIVVLRDVTERRKVEAMRRDFVADASHELKTPVASIQAAAETLVRAIGEDPVAARRFASQVHATSVRLSQMVTDLLDLSRMESERPDLHEVDLARLVRKEVDRIADRAEVQGVDLVLDVEEVVIQASRKDVRLAVRNLLENALAYTPEGGMVTVGTRREGAVAVLSVTDTGIGIPGRDTARIFERFYRVDDARHRDTGGTGLGLAIVRHVAEQHGGSVEVESELGRGSTFLIRLPLSPL